MSNLCAKRQACAVRLSALLGADSKLIYQKVINIMNMLYRIILLAEDGQYTIKDGYTSIRKAEYVANKLSSNYGEGQSLYVEQYSPGYWAA